MHFNIKKSHFVRVCEEGLELWAANVKLVEQQTDSWHSTVVSLLHELRESDEVKRPPLI